MYLRSIAVVYVDSLQSLPVVRCCSRYLEKRQFCDSNKSGDTSNLKNYRSVSNQSAILKLLDSLMSDHLNYSCKEQLLNEQYGFSLKKSTTTNLLLYEHRILETLENKHQIDANYADFSKAFDRVNQNILELFGFFYQLMKWF